jgi:hypothetical protein
MLFRSTCRTLSGEPRRHPPRRLDSVANWRTLVPCDRSSRTLSTSDGSNRRKAGRPRRFPALRARAIPAFTRACSISRGTRRQRPTPGRLGRSTARHQFQPWREGPVAGHVQGPASSTWMDNEDVLILDDGRMVNKDENEVVDVTPTTAPDED